MTPSARSGSLCRRVCRHVVLPTLALAVSVGATAQQPQTASGWIEKASGAGERHSFVADVVYEQGSHIEALRLWRDVAEDTRLRERLMTLSGPQREILRTSETTTYLMPSGSERLAQRYSNRSIGLPGPNEIDRLDEHYELNVDGDDRISDRPVQRIRLAPRDEFRYGYAFWLDRKTGLVLRADVIDQDSTPVERFLIVDLEFRDRLAPEALDPVLAENGTSFDRLTQRAESDDEQVAVQVAWSVTDLPEGFTLQTDRAQALFDRETPVRHMVFSDGMATVSVYIERHDAPNSLEGPMSMGGVNIHARTSNGVQTLVVGQVPAATVRRISTSLVRESDSNATGQ